MEIKFTNESGYAQPTHKEKIRRVSFGKFDLFGPRKCPRKNWKQRGHGDFITALKTVSFDEKTGSHSEFQVWGCRINSISWNYLSFSHLHPFSRKKKHLHVSSHVSHVSSHHPFPKGFSPFRKTQLGHPWASTAASAASVAARPEAPRTNRQRPRAAPASRFPRRWNCDPTW